MFGAAGRSGFRFGAFVKISDLCSSVKGLLLSARLSPHALHALQPDEVGFSDNAAQLQQGLQIGWNLLADKACSAGQNNSVSKQLPGLPIYNSLIHCLYKATNAPEV